MKKNNKKGFTLAELLIVVAIIAVLVAIAIPVFTAQLHRAQDATDLANIRSYYAELQTEALMNGKIDSTKLGTIAAGGNLPLNGGTVKLNNLSVTIADNGNNGYTFTWECASHGSNAGESSGTFGVAASGSGS